MRVVHCDSEFLFIKGNPEFLDCGKNSALMTWLFLLIIGARFGVEARIFTHPQKLDHIHVFSQLTSSINLPSLSEDQNKSLKI